MRKLISAILVLTIMLCSISSAFAETLQFKNVTVARGTAVASAPTQKAGWNDASVTLTDFGGSEWIYRVRKNTEKLDFVTDQIRRPDLLHFPYTRTYYKDGDDKSFGRNGYLYKLNIAHYSKAPLETAKTSGSFTP